MLVNLELTEDKRQEQVIEISKNMENSKKEISWKPEVRNEFTIDFNATLWQQFREGYVSIDPCQGPVAPNFNIEYVTDRSIKVHCFTLFMLFFCVFFFFSMLVSPFMCIS